MCKGWLVRWIGARLAAGYQQIGEGKRGVGKKRSMRREYVRPEGLPAQGFGLSVK